MALTGLRVIEMAGLAPAPFAGMVLAGINFLLLAIFSMHGGGTSRY